MTTADQLNYIKGQLDAWSKNNVGISTIASDMEDLLSQIRARQTASDPLFIVIVHHEVKRGEFEESGMVDRFFWVGISRPKGTASSDRGARLVKGIAGGPPLYAVVDSVRDDVIRNLQFEEQTTEVHPDYKGWEPMTVNDVTLTDVVRLEFSIGVQLKAPGST